jgi:hypothetical protein
VKEFKDIDNVAAKIFNDEIDRPAYAFGLWLATLQAKELGIDRLSVFEFGVATGAGLINLCNICEIMTKSTDMQYDIYGFDSDIGMPALSGGYKDHPELWHEGQFLVDHDAIREKLPENAKLISGDIATTLGPFCEEFLSPEAPVGFVSVDVDLYSSTLSVFELFKQENPEIYLPVSIMYLDDINDLLTNNSWCGEMLAVREWNEQHELRKMEEMRIRQNHSPAGWHDHIYGYHVLDHPVRNGMRPDVCLDLNITAI